MLCVAVAVVAVALVIVTVVSDVLSLSLLLFLWLCSGFTGSNIEHRNLCIAQLLIDILKPRVGPLLRVHSTQL